MTVTNRRAGARARILLSSLAALAASLPFAAPAAAARPELTPAAATPGEVWRGALRISQGCDGAPTRLIRITMPEGVVAVQPKARKGWLTETIWAPYHTPVEVHGRKVAEGVRAIVWRGDTLPDHMYDEFGFAFELLPGAAPAGGRLYFPVRQECETAVLDWTQVPAAGQDPSAPTHPAPAIAVASAGATPLPAGHDHHRPPAQAAQAAGLSVSGAWTRATPAGAKVAGAYVAIANRGPKPDVLTGGRFDVAGRVEVHDMTMTGGVMRMRRLENGLEIPAGGAVELRPGGLHLMLMDLKRPLKQGETIRGVLTFRDAGDIEVAMPVEAAGAPAPGKAPAAAGHGGGHHH